MRKIAILSVFLLGLASCNNDLTTLDVNQKSPTQVPATSLVSSAQLSLSNGITSPSVNSNVFRLLAQQWAQTTYPDESQYDLATRNIPQNFWNIMYRDVLQDLQEAKNVVNNDKTQADADVKANQLAEIDIMQVYTWFVLVNTFGDVPYSEALNYQVPSPKYDPAATVINDLVTRLDADLAALKPGAAGLGSGDLIYGGDPEKWSRFANSLKLAIGMILADADPAKAATIVAAAAPNAFQSNDDNAIFQYSSSSPLTSNPVWTNLVQSGRQDFVVANTLVDRMNTLNDPRREFYFGQVGGKFLGGVYGASNSYLAYSKPSDVVTDPAAAGPLLTYWEVEFYRAEAVERGFISGNAAEYYNNAITASIEYWGSLNGASAAAITTAATAYLAQPTVNYATAPGNFREKIGTQKWISLYNQGWNAWTEWRRLDYPRLETPKDAVLESIPVRLPYPVQEQNLNTANYNAASTAIGEDDPATKLFWDKF